MKKFLLSFLLVLLAASTAWATDVTFDLTKATYEFASNDEVVWKSNGVTITLSKSSSQTNANNYIPGTSSNYSSSRAYNSQVLTFESPVAITSIEFSATTANYAKAFAGATWDGATAAVSKSDNKLAIATATGSPTTITATMGTTAGATQIVVKLADGSNPPAPVPSISASNLDFGTANTGDAKALTITAANLTENITCTWDDGNSFSCSETFSKNGGDLYITFIGTNGGSHSDVLTLKSGEIETKVTVTAKVLALVGDGSLTNPYTVADVVLLNNPTNDNTNVWVKGIVVGAIVNNNFSATGKITTNIALGSTSSSSTLGTDIIPIELTNGSDARAALAGVSVGTELLFCGTLTKYFSVAGVKSLSNYGFVSYDWVMLDDETGLAVNTYTKAALYERECDLTKWHAICLPFDVDDWSKYSVIELSNTQNTENAVEFEYLEAGATMKAGTPYLIKSETETKIDFFAENVVLNAKAKTSTDGAISLVGTLAPVENLQNVDGEKWVYGLKDGVFRHAETARNMKAFRAYLEVPQPTGSAAPALKVMVGDDVNAIDDIKCNKVEDGVFYNLNGQRVDNPTKGLYIFNGVKVIIK